MNYDEFWWSERVADELFRQFDTGEITEVEYRLALDTLA